MPATNCTPSALLADAPCMGCLSQTQMLAVLVAILASDAGYTLPNDTAKVLSDSACFVCTSDKQLLQMFITTMAEEIGLEASEDTVKSWLTCLMCVDAKRLKSAIAYLTCKAFSRSQD